MRRSLVIALLIVALVVSFTTCSRDRAPLFDPGQPPPSPMSGEGIEVGPIDGLTLAWHPVPSHFAVPAGTDLRFRCQASTNDLVTWIGATEVGREGGWSIASCPTEANKGYEVSVRVLASGGQKDRDPSERSSTDGVAATRNYKCRFETVDARISDLVVKDVTLAREDLFVTEKSSNWEVLRQFGASSIARLTRVEPGHYRTSVATPLQLACKVEPAALGALVEWRVDGAPFALGQVVTSALNLPPGDREISAGPAQRAASARLSLYRVVSIKSSSSREDDITEGRPITYTAETEPVGFESEVTWLAATRDGKTTPVLGYGKTFTVRFENVIGVNPDGTTSRWGGVRADNATLTSDAVGPSISIDYPDADYPNPVSVINNGTWVVVDQPSNVPLASTTGVTFEYSANGGASYTPIEGPGEFGGWHAKLWNTKDLPSGAYLIRVMMTTLQGNASATRSVVVNTQPTATATAQSAGGLSANFNGASSFDPDGTLVQYMWRFSDGGTATGSSTQHTFASAGTHYMSLTVTDDRGGIDTAHYRVDIQPPAIFQFGAKEHCGCETMTVFGDGEILGPLAPAGWSFAPEKASGIAPGGQNDLGPYYDDAGTNVLPLASQPWNVRYRVEIFAVLTPGSNPKLCVEGQRAKGTWTRKGKTYDHHGRLSRGPGATAPAYDPSKGPDNPYDGTDGPMTLESGDCGYNAADPLQWCDDDYHGGGLPDGSAGNRKGGPPNKYKVYDDQYSIQWLDAPGLNKLTVDELPASFLAKFHSVVSGDLGTCDCGWNVLITIDVNRVVTADLVGVNCN